MSGRELLDEIVTLRAQLAAVTAERDQLKGRLDARRAHEQARKARHRNVPGNVPMTSGNVTECSPLRNVPVATGNVPGPGRNVLTAIRNVLRGPENVPGEEGGRGEKGQVAVVADQKEPVAVQPATDSVQDSGKLKPGEALFPEMFAEAWAKYPSRGGATNAKRDAVNKWNARIRAAGDYMGPQSPRHLTAVAMLAGVERYARFCLATGKTGTEFVMAAERFFGTGELFREEWAIPPKPGVVRPAPMGYVPSASSASSAGPLGSKVTDLPDSDPPCQLHGVVNCLKCLLASSPTAMAQLDATRAAAKAREAQETASHA